MSQPMIINYIYTYIHIYICDVLYSWLKWGTGLCVCVCVCVGGGGGGGGGGGQLNL